MLEVVCTAAAILTDETRKFLSLPAIKLQFLLLSACNLVTLVPELFLFHVEVIEEDCLEHYRQKLV